MAGLIKDPSMGYRGPTVETTEQRYVASGVHGVGASRGAGWLGRERTGGRERRAGRARRRGAAGHLANAPPDAEPLALWLAATRTSGAGRSARARPDWEARSHRTIAAG